MTMSPPLPPSPPEGPPRATNFSRRNAMQPFPPSPALTRIFASSMNMRPLTLCSPGSPVFVGFELKQRTRKSKSLIPKARLLARTCPPANLPTKKLLVNLDRLDHHELAHLSLIQELDAPRDLGEESVVFSAADVQ